MRQHITAIVSGKRYNTETATVLASNAYWDGSNYERGGTNCHLYRTAKGAYFAGYSTQWQDCRPRIEVLTLAEAQRLYEQLPEHAIEYEEAFPGCAAEPA